jgi:hypothetical protein
MTEPTRDLILAANILRRNLACISLMTCSAVSGHPYLREIAANGQLLLKDCAAFVVARSLPFDEAIRQLENRWCELLCVCDGVIEDPELQPTYSLVRSGDVSICAEALAKFQRLAKCNGDRLPVWAYVQTMSGLNSLEQLEHLLATAGRPTEHLERVMADVLKCEALLASGAEVSALIAGMNSISKPETHSEKINRYLSEERPVSGGCGQSSSLKALNTQVQGLLTSSVSEATAVFGAASSVFNSITNSTMGIVNAGPSQAGFSAAELNAKNAAAVESGATTERNLAGAAGTSAAAIGGGNAVTPAGGVQASVLAAKTAAAEQTATAENQIQTEDYAQGNANYNNALGAELKAPSVFDASTGAENAAVGAAGAATKVQTEMDSQSASSFWKNAALSAIGGVTGMATSGLMKAKLPSAPSASATPFATGGAAAVEQGN